VIANYGGKCSTNGEKSGILNHNMPISNPFLMEKNSVGLKWRKNRYTLQVLLRGLPGGSPTIIQNKLSSN
jgi:hypothetical protein